MDSNYDEQKVFDSVWQRVTGCSDDTETLTATTPDDKALLAALIAAEKGNHAFYHTAAHRAGSSCASLFNTLAQVSCKRLGRLQTFHFLICGNNCTANAKSFEVPSGTLAALRESYWRESETAVQLISAAASIHNGKFSSYASEFARQAAENAEHIIQLIDRIMK